MIVLLLLIHTYTYMHIHTYIHQMQYAMGQYGPPQGYGAGPQMSLGGYYGNTSYY